MKFILEELLKPATHRLASNVGVFLGTIGATTGEIEVIVAAIPVLAGLAIDFFIRRRL